MYFNLTDLSIADFSNAVQVTPEKLTCSDAAGVLFWQVRSHDRPSRPININ
jgi:hypothetical protein